MTKLTKLTPFLSFILLVLAGCSDGRILNSPADSAAQPSVRASEAISIARTYASHPWRPSSRNQFHGKDPSGLQVNTPDITMPRGLARRPGWWKPDQDNIGIPYKWGGFDTPLEFDHRLSNGAYAGDVYTVAKRKALYSGVSDYAAGVDCSGFVSRCWKLSRHYSTRALPALCTRVMPYEDLQPGDILNKYNVHVMLFAGYTDESKTHFTAFQTGAPPSWKVQEYTLNIREVLSWGFTPYRYNNLIQDLK